MRLPELIAAANQKREDVRRASMDLYKAQLARSDKVQALQKALDQAKKDYVTASNAVIAYQPTDSSD